MYRILLLIFLIIFFYLYIKRYETFDNVLTNKGNILDDNIVFNGNIYDMLELLNENNDTNYFYKINEDTKLNTIKIIYMKSKLPKKCITDIHDSINNMQVCNLENYKSICKNILNVDDIINNFKTDMYGVEYIKIIESLLLNYKNRYNKELDYKNEKEFIDFLNLFINNLFLLKKKIEDSGDEELLITEFVPQRELFYKLRMHYQLLHTRSDINLCCSNDGKNCVNTDVNGVKPLTYNYYINKPTCGNIVINDYYKGHNIDEINNYIEYITTQKYKTFSDLKMIPDNIKNIYNQAYYNIIYAPPSETDILINDNSETLSDKELELKIKEYKLDGIIGNDYILIKLYKMLFRLRMNKNKTILLIKKILGIVGDETYSTILPYDFNLLLLNKINDVLMLSKNLNIKKTLNLNDKPKDIINILSGTVSNLMSVLKEMRANGIVNNDQYIFIKNKIK